MSFGNLKSSEMKEISDYLSLLQIKYDCETVKSLAPCLQGKGGGVISLGITPYISLTAYSALEFLHNHGHSDLFDPDTKLLSNARLKLKLFENGYGKSRKMILNIDYLQDQIFRRKLKYSIMRKWNIHYNLGVFTDADRRVLCNTHYGYYALQDSALIKRSITTVQEAYEQTPEKFDFSGDAVYEHGYKCGQIISSIGGGLENFDSSITIMASNCDMDIFYADYNTNISSTLFPKGEEGKALQLYLLHTLSSINFVLYGLSIYEKEDYGWWLKIRYIAFFYAHRKLRDLREYLVQNRLLTGDMDDLIKLSGIDDMTYVSVNFRNNLMHADLMDKDGCFLIEMDKLDKAKPFFGLVESCFGGISYFELKDIVHNRLVKISDTLAGWLRTDKLDIKPLD